MTAASSTSSATRADAFGPELMLRSAREAARFDPDDDLATGLALAPLAIIGEYSGHGIGHIRWQSTMLVPLVTSTILNPRVLPSLFLCSAEGPTGGWSGRRAAKLALRGAASAATAIGASASCPIRWGCCARRGPAHCSASTR